MGFMEPLLENTMRKRTTYTMPTLGLRTVAITRAHQLL